MVRFVAVKEPTEEAVWPLGRDAGTEGLTARAARDAVQQARKFTKGGHGITFDFTCGGLCGKYQLGLMGFFMGRLEYWAVALAAVVFVGYGGRYLGAGHDVDAFCGTIAFIDAKAMSATAGVDFGEAFTRCKMSASGWFSRHANLQSDLAFKGGYK